MLVYPFSVIDVHSLTEAHPEWFEADGIHPNADGAKAMAEKKKDYEEILKHYYSQVDIKKIK